MKHVEQQNGDFESAAIRRLIDLRLKARLREKTDSSVAHPDDDVVNAFVEGQLEDAESLSVIAHLVSCTTCLHLTAQLVRFEPDLDEVARDSVPEEPSGRLQRFFDRLATGVTPGIGEDAVFAYEEKKGSGEKPEPRDEPPQNDSETK